MTSLNSDSLTISKYLALYNSILLAKSLLYSIYLFIISIKCEYNSNDALIFILYAERLINAAKINERRSSRMNNHYDYKWLHLPNPSISIIQAWLKHKLVSLIALSVM